MTVPDFYFLLLIFSLFRSSSKESTKTFKPNYVKINFRNLGFSAAFLTALYAFTGCNESTILGKDLIPGADKVTVKDTTINNLITLNVAEADSSIRTGQDNYGATFGAITDDPIFGKSYGFLYTQVGLPKLEFSFAGTGH